MSMSRLLLSTLVTNVSGVGTGSGTILAGISSIRDQCLEPIYLTRRGMTVALYLETRALHEDSDGEKGLSVTW